MPIDRAAVAARHSPISTSADHTAVFAVGNGQFAFSPDVTGFQSLNESYHDPFPLTTMSDWGWHSSPFPEGVDPFADYEYTGRFPSGEIRHVARDRARRGTRLLVRL